MKKRSQCLLLAVLFLASCKTDPFVKAKSTMGTWYEKKISFPEQVEYLNSHLVAKNDAIDYNQLSAKNTYYIVHYFDAGCDKCVNDLKNAQAKIPTMFKDKPVKFIFIADAYNSYFVKKAIDSIHFQYPVYYENQTKRLHEKNKFPMGDPLYNTFLINNKSELLLFGSVFDNEEARKFYGDLISN